MVKIPATCARCGTKLEGVEYVINVCIYDDNHPSNDSYVVCEQCYQTLKEVFEDGDIV